MLLSWLYSVIYSITLVAMLPWIGYSMLTKGKYRKNFLQRWGINYPGVQKKKEYLIWIHAVSVGEVKAAANLLRLIHAKYPDIQLIVSTVTETGHREAKLSIPFADQHVYLPFDLEWIVGPIVRSAKPDLVLITETDLWYNFLKSAKAAGAAVALINGKLSEKSMERYGYVGAFQRRLFAMVDRFYLQAEVYQERFSNLGIAQDKILVSGNLKFDQKTEYYPQETIDSFSKKLEIAARDILFVAGSTHDPEERILIDLYKKLSVHIPYLKLVLVPRHPDRFDEVAQLIQDAGLPYKRFSSDESVPDAQVILVDAMGQLMKCYSLAKVAFVGGSFTERVGGHNILEPCHYSVPVLFGPYMHGQPELTRLVLSAHAGYQVHTTDELAERIADLCVDSLQSEQLGAAGRKLIDGMYGSSERTLRAIEPFFSDLYNDRLQKKQPVANM